MPASFLLLLVAALPLAFAAPQHIPDRPRGYGQTERPGSIASYGPTPSWSHGPYIPLSGSGGFAVPSGTGCGTGSASWGAGTGSSVYPSRTIGGTGSTSILPIYSSSSTSVYAHPIRSSSSSSVEEPLGTTSQPCETTPTATSYADQAVMHDTVKFEFASSTTWAFSGLSALPTGLRASTDFIASEPLTHTFAKRNVKISDGMLSLVVPGGQGGQGGQNDISSAEIVTDFSVKHASVRTWAILTDEPGVCNGIFLYKSDSQETDIEWISDSESQSNKFANNGTRALQYTNQALNGVFEDATSAFGRAPKDVTSAIHEYRLDWLEDRTDFFIDGVFQHSLTTNVPTEAGPWVWNNWANGDPHWTADPPKEDAEFKIERIEMYYNPA